MYGINGFDDDEQLQQLLGFRLPEQQFQPQSFQAQDMPQLQQGLLGSSGEEQQDLQNLISKGSEAVAQLAQTAQPSGNGNDNMAAMSSQNQQALAQQQQQEQQQREMLLKLAQMFMSSGGA